MKYAAVLFDADGMTLVPKRFSEQIEEEYGIAWATMKPFFQGAFAQCKVGKADLKEELAKVLDVWGWKGSVEELMAYWFSIGSTPNSEIAAIAQALRQEGTRCFLATNQECYRAEYLREVVGLKEVFDELFVSAEFGCMKNDVRYFQMAHERISHLAGSTVPKEAVLFVDHEQENLDAAKSYGFSTFFYHDVAGFRSEVLG